MNVEDITKAAKAKIQLERAQKDYERMCGTKQVTINSNSGYMDRLTAAQSQVVVLMIKQNLTEEIAALEKEIEGY